MVRRWALLFGMLLPFSAAAQLIDPANLAQEAPLGETLAPNGVTGETTVYLGASSSNPNDPDCLYCYLSFCQWTCVFEFEIRPRDSGFTNTPSFTGPSNAPFHAISLLPGTYRWQVREKAGATTSGWVRFNAGSDAFQISLAEVLLVPETIEFAETSIGASATRALVVSNPGASTLRIESIEIIGRNAADFGVTAHVPVEIVAGGTATVVVTFSPSSGAARIAALELLTNAPTDQLISVPLSGVGGEPKLRATPSALEFGNVRVDRDRPLTVTLQNLTTESVSLDEPTIAPSESGFAAVLESLIVPPGGSISATITFGPRTPGPQQAEIAFPVRGESPLARVAATATGVPASVTIEPPTLDFGTIAMGETASLDVRLTNVTSEPISLSPNSTPSEVSIDPTPPMEIPAGAFVDVLLRFTPSRAGPFDSALQMQVTGSDETISLGLTGVGLASADDARCGCQSRAGAPIGPVLLLAAGLLAMRRLLRRSLSE